MARSTQTNATNEQESTAETSLIGIDAEGSEHRWVHHRQQVRVQRPDETVDVYGAESVSAWCEIVDKQLGWVRCHARMSTAELIAEGLQA
jgi:hypothetical protein